MESFKNILDSDEYIINEYKPDKRKFYLTRILSVLFIVIFLSFPLMVSFTIFDPFDIFINLIITILIILFVLIVLTTLLSKYSYEKRLYAYTNKRILIRTGIVGVDFKSLDIKAIGASEVTVDLIDKLVRRNTGTIKFGSHVTTTSTTGIKSFQFVGIKDPYDVYREIKKYMDQVNK